MRWEILILEGIIFLSGEQEPEEHVLLRYDAHPPYRHNVNGKITIRNRSLRISGSE